VEKVEKETAMKSSVTPEAVLEAIERRVAGISAEQHALAVEKGRLLEHVTPLRLGIVSAELVLVQLKTRGIRLAGLTGTGPPAPREEPSLTTSVRTAAWPPERHQPAGRRASVSTRTGEGPRGAAPGHASGRDSTSSNEGTSGAAALAQYRRATVCEPAG
jgi:hypothetical protein